MPLYVLSLINNIPYRFKKLSKLKQNNTEESKSRQHLVILLNKKKDTDNLKPEKKKGLLKKIYIYIIYKNDFKFLIRINGRQKTYGTSLNNSEKKRTKEKKSLQISISTKSLML